MAIRTCKHCAYWHGGDGATWCDTANATQNPTTTRTDTAHERSGLRKSKRV